MHARDSSIFILTYIVGPDTPTGFLRLLAQPGCGRRWVWVGWKFTGGTRARNSFIFFVLFCFSLPAARRPPPYVPLARCYPPSPPAARLSALPTVRATRFSSFFSLLLLSNVYLLLRGCSIDRKPAVNIVWLLLRRGLKQRYVIRRNAAFGLDEKSKRARSVVPR